MEPVKPEPKVVALRWYEIAIGLIAGVHRFVSVLRGSRNSKVLPKKNQTWWDELIHHMRGACAEYAAAKALCCTWPATVDTFKSLADIYLKADDGGHVGVEVRARKRDWYDIIIRQDDPDDVPFVLVTDPPEGELEEQKDGERRPRWLVWGWIYGREAKQDKYRANWNDRGECWAPPKSALHPLDDLRRIQTHPPHASSNGNADNLHSGGGS